LIFYDIDNLITNINIKFLLKLIYKYFLKIQKGIKVMPSQILHLNQAIYEINDALSEKANPFFWFWCKYQDK
jgi:hypothetical protein